jgi:RNA polymerase sigma factor (sigma-70 family)
VSVPPFQSFLDEHREAVYRFLVASAGPQEAEDCFQETFLSALRAYPRLRDGSNLRSWVLTIAHRKAIDAHRARRRRPEPSVSLPEVATQGDEPGDGQVWRRVRALPPRQRAAVFLRYAGDLPYGEVARIVGTTEAAARQSARAGLATLRREWER